MKHHKNLTRLLCCLLCLCLCLSACKRAPEPTTTAPKDSPKDVIYTVTLKTAGGMVLSDVAVYVYEDATEDDLLTYGNLDNNGAFTFTAPESSQYTVRFAGLPKEGYDVQPYYPITSQNTDIVLTSSVVTGLDALEEGKEYHLGDVMRDFTVTTVDGEELTLSKLLEEKEAVVLNFWYTGCGPCKNEFPLLQAAYEAYSDKIEVIAMDPTDISRDTVEGIKAFRDQNGLTMPMAVCSGQWFSALGINAYPTTVVIDRYGVVCLITGTVDEPGVFESIFEHFTAENYAQKLVEDVSELHVVEYPEGHERNPYQTHGAVGQFTVTVPADSEFHVLLYKADGLTLHIENPNAYVRYGEKTYSPNANGVIDVVIDNPDMMIGAALVIGNTSAADASVTVELQIPQGTTSTPYEAKLGSVTVDVAEGNDQGVHYSWIATGNGLLTLTVTGAPENEFDVQLYNTTTMAVRNLGEEPLVDENGNRYVCVEVNAGDEVRISYLIAPDAEGNYPATTIEAELSLTQMEENVTEYRVTVVDESGNPVKDVEVIIVIKNAQTSFKTDEAGMILVTLPTETYTVMVTAPEGYTCDTTQFLLSETNAAKEVVLSRVVIQPVTYTVYVKDETGKPVANATVILDGVSYYTDENGVFSFELLASDSYAVTVRAPEGYTLEKNEYAFGTETTITVTVTRAVEPEPEKATYTVYVKDETGKPVANATVILNGTSYKTDSKGACSFELVKGNDYTVTVVAPEGYTLASNQFAFGTGTTINVTVTRVVEPGPDPEPEKTTYTVYVKDDAGTPVANAKVTLNGTSYYTDAKGVCSFELVKGNNYSVTVAAPEGYTLETTKYSFGTNTSITVTVKRVVVEPEKATYTVYVKDETGAPVANAKVTLNGTSYYTDAKGVCSFELVKGNNYSVTVAAPEGYTLETTKYSFGTNTSITVTVKRAVVEEKKIEYKVYLKDQDGKVLSGIQVRLDAESGSANATATTDSKGCATFQLPEGNYTVTVSSSTLGFEPTNNKLTAKNTSLTIEMVPYVGTEVEDVFPIGLEGDYRAAEVSTGSCYVDMTNTDIRFFIFTPEKAGKYSITTTNSNAKISYWGGTFYTKEDPSFVKNNVCTIEVKDAGPSFVLAIRGGSNIKGTVLKITRTGNASKDPERVNFEGSTEPTEPFVVQDTGTKTYFDLSIAHTLVKGSDGFYHYGSADGKIVYMDLKGAQYGISISTVLSTSAMFKMEYDSSGNPVKRIDYTNCMNKYVENADKKYGVYALTDDLITIIKNHGKQQGWYDKNSMGFYLFDGEDVLAESAWMFLLCTIQ